MFYAGLGYAANWVVGSHCAKTPLPQIESLVPIWGSESEGLKAIAKGQQFSVAGEISQRSASCYSGRPDAGDDVDCCDVQGTQLPALSRLQLALPALRGP